MAKQKRQTGMMFRDFSRRSKSLYWLYTLILAVGVGLVLGLLISLGGYFIAGWQDAPVNEVVGLMVRWMLVAFIPLIALRLALNWSLKKDLQRH